MSRNTPHTRQLSASHWHWTFGSTVRQQSMRKVPSSARTTSSIGISAGSRESIYPGFGPPTRECRIPACTSRSNAGERARTLMR
ncbi:hypothetical protein ABHC70_18165 [Parabacteroides distasonis]|nr:hypothetical protein [Parabacteroides sp. CT06]